MLYRFRLLFLLFILLHLYSCNESAVDTKKVFYLNLSSGSLESLDPAYAKDLYTMWTTHMIYNTLVETNDQLQICPSIAKSWELSKDQLTYTFHLRRGIFFQKNEWIINGMRTLNAHDVVYSFSRIMDTTIVSSGAWIFNGRVVQNNPFTALDDSTFQIKLIRPFSPFVTLLSMPYCSILPQEVVAHWGKDFRRHPCGTGPFQYGFWDEGNALALLKNPLYWEQDSNHRQLPYLDAVQLSFYDSKATEFLLFRQGKLDFINGIDGSFKDVVLTKMGMLKPDFSAQFNLTKSTYLNTEYIGFLVDTNNTMLKLSATKYKAIRQAINYAIDRPKIATYYRNGVVLPAQSGFIPLGLLGYDSTEHYGYHFNPAKALQLLAEAGFPQGKGLPPITFLTPDSWADVVNFICAELKDVGIEAHTEVMQPNILRQQMSESKAVTFRGQWIADYPDAESFLAVFNSRLPAPPNYTRFKNKLFDEWYDKAMLLPEKERYPYYQKMDSLVMEEAPVIPLFYDRLLHFTQKNSTGFTSNPMNLIELKWVHKF